MQADDGKFNDSVDKSDGLGDQWLQSHKNVSSREVGSNGSMLLGFGKTSM